MGNPGKTRMELGNPSDFFTVIIVANPDVTRMNMVDVAFVIAEDATLPCRFTLAVVSYDG